jgi:hypothetical protein
VILYKDGLRILNGVDETDFVRFCRGRHVQHSQASVPGSDVSYPLHHDDVTHNAWEYIAFSQ